MNFVFQDTSFVTFPIHIHVSQINSEKTIQPMRLLSDIKEQVNNFDVSNFASCHNKCKVW